ncbi:hypothetical protein SRIMM317S_01730 [Streptomyces rimosus subsp. rimosus]
MLSTAAASALVPGERRGRALALVMGGMSTGTVLGVPVGAAGRARGVAVDDVAGHGVGAVALVGLAALLPPVPADPPVPARARLAAVADQEVAPIVGVSFLAAVASLGLYTYLAPVLASAGGVTEVGPYLWAWGIGGVVGSLVAGPLVDRTGKAAALVGGVLVTVAVAQVLLPLLASAGAAGRGRGPGALGRGGLGAPGAAAAPAARPA